MLIPSNIEIPPLQFSGHETFPLRQLWLRKAFDNIVSFTPSAPKSVFANEDAIVRFGVGKNMVMSIRHWALACAFMDEAEDGGYIPTELAKLIFGNDSNGLDPYVESPATAWLIHWKLAGMSRKSTTWWWVFNCIVQQTFDKDALLVALRNFCKTASYRVSDSTLIRDIDVCIASYLPRAGGGVQEDAAEPLLSELTLLQQHLGMRGTFSFRRGPKSTLPDALFAYALIEFWQRRKDISVLSFEKIVHDYGSPGRVFKLDENSVGERVLALEDLTKGVLRWTDTSGIRQVNRTTETFNARLIRGLVEAAYD